MADFNGGQRFWTFQMLVRLKFYTSIFGAIIKSLLAKNGIFSMMNFRHSRTLRKQLITIRTFISLRFSEKFMTSTQEYMLPL